MDNEETTQSDQPVETTTEAPAETLDDIASEFKVDEQVSQFQAQPQQPAPVQETTPQGIPDPISNPEGYDFFMQQQVAQSVKFNDTLNTLADKVQGYEQSFQQQKIDADLKEAATHLNEKLKQDSDIAEIVMEKEYRNNPSFKKIWDNRAQNPAAFKKALDVIGDKWAGKFVNQADPQLSENVRAAKLSQQTMSGTVATDKDDEWSGLSEAEFSAKWANERG